MNFFCICDNIDTQMGMRLAGIDGVVVHEKDEVSAALQTSIQNPNIGIILMTEKLCKLGFEEIYQLKLTLKQPLIVEIPDRHGGWDVSDNIARYVKEAIGIQV